MSAHPFRPGIHLSVAIVARDDQAVLAETFTSLGQLASEVVVLDAGSTDRTAEVAKAHGARVIPYAWQRDFSAARNHLLARLTGHWVLWLEPGERLAAETPAELRRFLDAQPDRDTAYTVLVEQPAAARTDRAEQAALVRLAPNRPEIRFEGRVRETLKPSLEAAGMRLALAPGRIVQHARCRDRQWIRTRAGQSLELAALETTLGAEPSVRALLATAEAAFDLEDRALARQAFSEVVRTALPRSLEMLEGYHGLVASLEGGADDAQGRLSVCLEAVEAFPLDAPLLCALGSCLQSQNQLDLAIRTFEIALQHGQVHLETWHPVDVEPCAAACLSLCLRLKGEDERACRVLEEALARAPRSESLRRQLVDLHIHHGRAAEAVAAADGIVKDASQREPLRNAVRGACRAVEQDWTPALAHLQSAYLAGCDDPICLRWLAVVLLSTGQTESAEPVLRRWLAVEPDNSEVRAYANALAVKPDSAAQTDQATGSRLDPDQWLRIDPATSAPERGVTAIPIASQAVSASTPGA